MSDEGQTAEIIVPPVMSCKFLRFYLCQICIWCTSIGLGACIVGFGLSLRFTVNLSHQVLRKASMLERVLLGLWRPFLMSRASRYRYFRFDRRDCGQLKRGDAVGTELLLLVNKYVVLPSTLL